MLRCSHRKVYAHTPPKGPNTFALTHFSAAKRSGSQKQRRAQRTPLRFIYISLHSLRAHTYMGGLMIRLNRYLHNGNVLLVCRLRRRWSLAPRWKRRSRYLFTPTLANGEKYRRRGLAWPRRASRPLPGGERSRSIERPTNPFPGSGSALLLGSAGAFSPRGPPKGSAGAAMAAMAGCYCCCTQKIRQESSF